MYRHMRIAQMIHNIAGEVILVAHDLAEEAAGLREVVIVL